MKGRIPALARGCASTAPAGGVVKKGWANLSGLGVLPFFPDSTGMSVSSLVGEQRSVRGWRRDWSPVRPLGKTAKRVAERDGRGGALGSRDWSPARPPQDSREDKSRQASRDTELHVLTNTTAWRRSGDRAPAPCLMVEHFDLRHRMHFPQRHAHSGRR